MATVEGSLLDAFRCQIRALRVERHFTLIERTPDRRYALASANVAVLPWSIDYQPPFPHEAIAANTPIVATYVETYCETARKQDRFPHAANSPLVEQLARSAQRIPDQPGCGYRAQSAGCETWALPAKLRILGFALQTPPALVSLGLWWGTATHGRLVYKGKSLLNQYRQAAVPRTDARRRSRAGGSRPSSPGP